jgi:hypothetical protein
VDARLLDHMSKKDLEKYLGVTKKFHMASIAHGVHLLRIVGYDRQVGRLAFFLTQWQSFIAHLLKQLLCSY